MDNLINLLIDVVLMVLVAAMILSAVRVFRGGTPLDRLQASDLVTTITIALVAVVGLAQDSPLLIDLGIALAAFSFIGTIAVARFMREGKVF
ncbi:MAG: pesticidal protein Cry22Aa [Chloroflexi bacterium]|nr:pesticidal protein Cry22Aa [Chloroflexota bacterium]